MSTHRAELERMTASLIAILSNTYAADAKQHRTVPEMLACMMVQNWRGADEAFLRTLGLYREGK